MRGVVPRTTKFARYLYHPPASYTATLRDVELLIFRNAAGEVFLILQGLMPTTALKWRSDVCERVDDPRLVGAQAYTMLAARSNALGRSVRSGLRLDRAQADQNLVANELGGLASARLRHQIEVSWLAVSDLLAISYPWLPHTFFRKLRSSAFALRSQAR